MALQYQTYANSGSGYYIQGAVPNNPSTMTALNGPVEILFTSSIKGDYYGELNQTPSTFTISENLTSSLSTINSLVFDPVNAKTTMNVYNINNAIAEPVIQQWSLTSSIVNGIFKVGNKALNNEPDALIMTNSGNVTNLRQGNELNMIIDGPNQRTRFTGVTDPSTYVDIGSGYGTVPKGNVKCANDTTNANVVIDPTKITFNVATNNGKAIVGVNGSAPYQTYMSSKNAIDFVVDDIGAVITPLTLNKNGTVNMYSTLTVPYISTNSISTTNIVATYANLTNLSTVQINSGIANVPIVVNGSLAITMLPPFLVGPSGSNACRAPRLITSSNIDNPTTYYPASVGDGMIIQSVLRDDFGAPLHATNSMEFIQNSSSANGGFQFYHGSNSTINTPEWLGGFQYNPKEFRLASTLAAVLPIVSASTITTNTINANSINVSTATISTASISTASISTASITTLTNVSTASIQELTNLSSINTLPIASYLGNPIGTMLNWAGTNANAVPTGYLLCDGEQYFIAGIYQALYNVIGDWDYYNIPGKFRVPDARGKSLMGSLTTPNNCGQAGAYSVLGVGFGGLVTVTLPASFGGGNRDAVKVGGFDRALYVGMRIVNPTNVGWNMSAYIVGFINSDGLYGTGPTTASTTDTIVLFNISQTTSASLGATINFETNDASVRDYPFIGQSWTIQNPSIGCGRLAELQRPYEVAQHTHTMLQPGGTSSQVNGAQNRAGDPNLGGPTISQNSDLFTYTQDALTGIVNRPIAKYNLPYNIATWQIIKY